MINPPSHLTDLTLLEPKKKKFIRAFQSSFFNVQAACQKVNISRQTFYNWIKADKNFSVAIEDLQEATLDFAESQLFRIMEGNTSASVRAITFFLETKGKKRGYSEQIEESCRPCSCSTYANMTDKELEAELTLFKVRQT